MCKISDTVKLDAGIEIIKKTFTDRKYLRRFSFLLDAAILTFLLINTVMLYYGSEAYYDRKQI